VAALVGAPPGRPLPERALLQQLDMVSRVDPREPPAERLREAHGRSAARAVDGQAGGPSHSAQSSRPSCVSVAGGAELVDDALRDAAARRDLDLVRLGPRADGLRAVVDRGGRFCDGGAGSVLSAAELARGPYVAVQRCPHFDRMLVRQIDLVLTAVESKTDRLAGAVDELGVVQVVDKSDN